ncbi:Rha family transcriptional regulator [Salmonella enterica]|nr:DNA-binding protein [Salmonella enterica]ECD7245017.1 DNA-binding protein [Salmonella enterica subsp. enterica serovar Florida]ECF4168406.1 DNA-binding protein [Salmonella enterica subsp. enterica serovar Florida]ECW2477144.1 DNA-binding protein [Salmonella enterica subsp. enterica serovar Florida]EEN2097570.1 DNA-binding protein [Salmonella enterica subsp. enterica serovar Florida]
MKNMINSKPSMTSIEIADLVGSRHDSVKRSIERLVDDGVIQLPPMVDCGRINGLGVSQKSKHYLFEGEQGRRDSIVVVAQLCPKFTGRLVDRWQELERKVEQLNTGEQTIQYQREVDIVALACAVAETTVTTAIKAAIEAATVQQGKLASQRRDSDDFVVFDYSSTDSEVDNSVFQPIHALSAKSGLADSACRRLIEFAHVPARKIGRSGLHADSDAFVAAACKLIGESEPPKGKIKRWQHPEFGGFILRRAVSESGQEKKD